MRTPILALLASCAVATAQDDSLLARLEAETTKLAERARGAAVVVTYDTPRPAWPAAVATPANAYKSGVLGYLFASTPQPAQANGVLAGSPARVVAPYATAAEVTVRFRDGSTVRARHAGGDEELGISIYALPDERGGLALAADWPAAGTLAVASDGDLGLALVQGTHRALGWVHGPAAPAGAFLVGRGGTLLGLRAGPPTAATTANASWMYYNALDGNPTVVSHSTPQPAGNLYLAGPVVRRVLDDVAAIGRVRRGYLGVILGEVVQPVRPVAFPTTAQDGRSDQPFHAEAVRLRAVQALIPARPEPGIPVTAVLDGSPAQKAGVKAGSRIRLLDGVPCDDAATFSRLLALRAPGEEIVLTVGDEEVRVTLADREAAQAALVSEETLGMTCVDVGPELRSFLGLADDVRGVVVREVRPGSPAAAAGLQRGDVVWWGGDGAIADLEELRAAIAGAKDTVALRVQRGGAQHEVTVRLPEARTSTR